MLLPLYIPLVWSGLGQAEVRRILGLSDPWARLWPLCWAIVAGVAALGWVITMSRGAWMGLLGAGVLWALWRGAVWWSTRPKAIRNAPGACAWT